MKTTEKQLKLIEFLNDLDVNKRHVQDTPYIT